MSAGRRLPLIAGGTGTLLIALLHVAIIFAGPRAWLYFGAPRLARLAKEGSAYPAVLTALLAVVFLVWAAYAFTGAGLLRMRLPLLRPALFAIGAIYTLRGLEVIPDLIRVARSAGYPLRQTVFSAAALVLGILYLAGAARRQKRGER